MTSLNEIVKDLVAHGKMLNAESMSISGQSDVLGGWGFSVTVYSPERWAKMEKVKDADAEDDEE